MAYDALPARDAPLSDAALAQLFTEARTRNAWTDRPVEPEHRHHVRQHLPVLLEVGAERRHRAAGAQQARSNHHVSR
ncbi:MAG: hypothetical protein LCH57_03445, partial [Proteobacteria bacterium]|nr:hypothetical protein [Pseudomonadota bacterium]